MKKPITAGSKHEEELSDTFSTTAPNSSHAYLDETASPDYRSNSSSPDDAESLSDDSGRNRKKRNAYQKISDDIRVKLLESVQRGETLKAAAKRFKINYSSAKSILHTFRKEGRILKKSAQERITKKRSLTSDESEMLPKPTKIVKREKVQITKVVAPFIEKVQIETPREETHFTPSTAVQENYVNMMETDHHAPTDVKPFDNYFVAYPETSYHDNEMNYFEGHNYTSFTQPPKEFDSFNDMVTALQTRPLYTDDAYHDMKGFNTLSIFEDRPMMMENGLHFGGNGEKNFIDTQDVFRSALRKDSVSSYTGGFRKGSIDLF